VQERHTRPVQGRTRWRRFATVTIPAMVAIGGIVIAMADGALAASFAVSGTTFKVSADVLDGTGFVQYGGMANQNTKPPFAAVAGIGSAKITGMCQSVSVIPGKLSVVLTAGKDPKNPAVASNLMFDMQSMQGDADFTNLNIGQDASTLTGAGPNAHGAAGTFGQQADTVVLTKVKQVAYSASAGTFTLPGLSLSVDASGTECF
jgi:hypothetical protein